MCLFAIIAYNDGKVAPCCASHSWSDAVAIAGVASTTSVIFSTPAEITTSWKPDATAIIPCLKASPPDAHAASTLVVGIGLRPMWSEISAAICSWSTNKPEDIFPTYIASISSPSTSASITAFTPASAIKSLKDESHNSPNLVCETPIIATSLIITPTF